MLPLKLVRSLILGEAINSHSLSMNQKHLTFDDDDANHAHVNMHARRKSHRRRKTGRKKANQQHKREEEEEEEEEDTTKKKTPLLLFVPSKELVSDTYRLASIARDIGMDLHPTPSLSHIIFTYTPSSSPSPSCSTSSCTCTSSSSSWSTTSLSSSLWSLPNDAVPLPFPTFTVSSLPLLRSFVAISKGFFKLVFVDSEFVANEGNFGSLSNWDCCSLSLFSRLTCERIESMDGFSRALAGMGWTLFKSKKISGGELSLGRSWGRNSVYLFRKVDTNRVRLRRGSEGGGSGNGNGECRVRELRLPQLDFRNAPLRILQYILLMTDDVFFLA